MGERRWSRAIAMVPLVALWVVSGLLAAVHVLGVISTPGIAVVMDGCPPRSTGLRELCAPMHVRVELPAQVPPEPAASDLGRVELSGPIEATLALTNTTVQQRFAYNAPSGLAWLTVFVFLGLFVWPTAPARLLGVRRCRRTRTGADSHPGSTGDHLDGWGQLDGSGVDVALTLGGVIVAVGGLATAAVQRWSVGMLADAANAGYEPATVLPVGAAAVPVVIGVGLVLVGSLRQVTRRQSADLEGMV